MAERFLKTSKELVNTSAQFEAIIRKSVRTIRTDNHLSLRDIEWLFTEIIESIPEDFSFETLTTLVNSKLKSYEARGIVADARVEAKLQG